MAVALPMLFGQPSIWSALSLEGLLSWQTALGGILGLVLGIVIFVLITHWRPLHVVAQHMAVLVAWETFRTRDYVAVALLAALGEELFFRGALQQLIGLVPAAVVFGLLHATAVAHVILATLLGLWLGLLCQWSGSLWPPIVAHLVLDLVIGLLLARRLRTRALSGQGV
jgi:membrane protease YdiL (CAAX protease family)